MSEQQPIKQPMEQSEEPNKQENSMNPVRKWTFIILATVMVLLIWHLIADRFTPFTSQARVHALVVPIAAQISGKVISVAVSNNQQVEAGQELFRIDPESYQLAVQTAKAKLVSVQAKAQQSQRDYTRLKRIRDHDAGAISERRVESAKASLASAVGQLDGSKSKLKNAQLNLARTVISAPEIGVVTDVRINNGGYAAASAPQMTFIAVQHIWVQADFTENNLGHLKAGNEVKLVFDAMPGQVVTGHIREIGYGVAVDSTAPGSLPSIQNDRAWLRDSQRFPVLIDFPFPIQQGHINLRVGSQATAVVLTEDSIILNTLAKLEIWLTSILTYAY